MLIYVCYLIPIDFTEIDTIEEPMAKKARVLDLEVLKNPKKSNY